MPSPSVKAEFVVVAFLRLSIEQDHDTGNQHRCRIHRHPITKGFRSVEIPA
jgi:hypothetical protein